MFSHVNFNFLNNLTFIIPLLVSIIFLGIHSFRYKYGFYTFLTLFIIIISSYGIYYKNVDDNFIDHETLLYREKIEMINSLGIFKPIQEHTTQKNHLPANSFINIFNETHSILNLTNYTPNKKVLNNFVNFHLKTENKMQYRNSIVEFQFSPKIDFYKLSVHDQIQLLNTLNWVYSLTNSYYLSIGRYTSNTNIQNITHAEYMISNDIFLELNLESTIKFEKFIKNFNKIRDKDISDYLAYRDIKTAIIYPIIYMLEPISDKPSKPYNTYLFLKKHSNEIDFYTFTIMLLLCIAAAFKYSNKKIEFFEKFSFNFLSVFLIIISIRGNFLITLDKIKGENPINFIENEYEINNKLQTNKPYQIIQNKIDEIFDNVGLLDENALEQKVEMIHNALNDTFLPSNGAVSYSLDMLPTYLKCNQVEPSEMIRYPICTNIFYRKYINQPSRYAISKFTYNDNKYLIEIHDVINLEAEPIIIEKKLTHSLLIENDNTSLKIKIRNIRHLI